MTWTLNYLSYKNPKLSTQVTNYLKGLWQAPSTVELPCIDACYIISVHWLHLHTSAPTVLIAYSAATQFSGANCLPCLAGLNNSINYFLFWVYNSVYLLPTAIWTSFLQPYFRVSIFPLAWTCLSSEYRCSYIKRGGWAIPTRSSMPLISASFFHYISVSCSFHFLSPYSSLFYYSLLTLSWIIYLAGKGKN